MALTNLCIAANGSPYAAETWSNLPNIIDSNDTTYASLTTGSTPTSQYNTTIGFTFNTPTNVGYFYYRFRMGRYYSASPGDTVRIIAFNGATEVYTTEITRISSGSQTTSNIAETISLGKNHLITRIVVQFLFDTYFNGTSYAPLEVSEIKAYAYPNKLAADTNILTSVGGTVLADTEWSNAGLLFDGNTETEATCSTGTVPTTTNYPVRLTLASEATISRIRLIQGSSIENNCTFYKIGVSDVVTGSTRYLYEWIRAFPGTILDINLDRDYAANYIVITPYSDMNTYEIDGVTYYEDVCLAEVQAFSNTTSVATPGSTWINLCTAEYGVPWAAETWNNLSYATDMDTNTLATLETGSTPTTSHDTSIGFVFDEPQNIGVIMYSKNIGRTTDPDGDLYKVIGYDELDNVIFVDNDKWRGSEDPEPSNYVSDSTHVLSRNYTVSKVVIQFLFDTYFDGVSYSPIKVSGIKMYSIPERVAADTNLLTEQYGIFNATDWEETESAFDEDETTDAIFSSGEEATTDAWYNFIEFFFPEPVLISRIRIINSQNPENNCTSWRITKNTFSYGSFTTESDIVTTAGAITDINFNEVLVDSIRIEANADMGTYEFGGVTFYNDVHVAEIQAFSNSVTEEPTTSSGYKAYIMEG